MIGSAPEAANGRSQRATPVKKARGGRWQRKPCDGPRGKRGFLVQCEKARNFLFVWQHRVPESDNGVVGLVATV